MNKPRKGPETAPKVISLSELRRKRMTLDAFDELEREARRQSKDKAQAVRQSAKDKM